MGFFSRMAALFGGGRNTAGKSDAGTSSGDQLTLAQARLKQQAAVQKMRRGVADVSVSRQRLDLQRDDLQKAIDALTAQAQKASHAGDDGAAQTAQGRLHIMGEQMADLTSQRDALAEQETMLIAALTQLQARVSGFNVTAETLGATHKAADASHAIAKALEEFENNQHKPNTGP